MQALALADAVRAQEPGPDILINNAARTAAIWQASVDLVLASAVNYLAGYLLTRKLLPLLMGRLS